MDGPFVSDADTSALARQRDAIATLGTKALETDDIDELLAETVDTLTDALVVDAGTVFERQSDDSTYLLRAGTGWAAERIGTVTVASEATDGLTFETAGDVDEDATSGPEVTQPRLFDEYGVRNSLTTVVQVEDEPWGLLGVQTTSNRSFTDQDAAFLEHVADLLASAIDAHTDGLRGADRRPGRIASRSPIGLAIVAADGTIEYANERARELYGCADSPQGSFPNVDTLDLVDGYGEALSREERPFRRVVDTGEPVYDVDIGLRRPDGRRAWVSVNAGPLRESAEAVERVVLAFTDVSDSKHIEGEFEEILDRVTDAFYALDEEFRFTHVNERAEALLQHDESALLGERLWDVFPSAAEIDEVWEAFHVARETNEPTGYELYYDHLDFWVEASIYPSESGLSVYFRDATERKKREAELERTERRFEAIFEDPNILVGLLEPDGTVLDINETAMAYIDAELDDVLGEQFWETPWWGEGDDVQEAVREWTERAAAGEYVEFETDLTRPTGDGYTLNGVFRPVTDDDGDVVSVLVSDRDVTARKTRERQLQESEERHRTLAENFPNGIVTLFDDDLRYTLAAGQGFADLPIDAGDLEGQYVGQAWPSETAEALEPAFEVALDGEKRVIELEYVDREWVVRVVPLTEADGTVFGGMTLAQDITERKERERRLEGLVDDLAESNRRLEQFAYAASHDLQEPLRMVSSYLQLVESRYGDALDEDGEAFLDYAVDGAERMRGMIDGLLEYSRVETEGDPVEPVDLNDVLAETRANLEVRIDESDAEITVEDLPRVLGDANQLGQVFQNLLSNAIEYSGDDAPRAHVSAERDGSVYRIAVDDDGIGIDPAYHDQIFDVFERLHDAASHDGTGIGLALCERIVERHGGEIRVASDSGAGSTFYVTLPAADDEGRERERSSGA